MKLNIYVNNIKCEEMYLNQKKVYFKNLKKISLI